MERMFVAYFTESHNLENRELLADLAAEVGLSKEEAQALLESDAYSSEVRADEAEARRIGISGVPFFVLGGKYAVSGAQPPGIFIQALEKAYSEEKPLVIVNGNEDSNGGACSEGACDIPSKS